MQSAPKPAIANVKAVRACESLASVMLPNTTIESAAVDPNNPAVCRVTAITTHPPSPDKIRIWVAIPTSNWNGRFVGTGGGGLVGGNPAGVNQPVAQGFAAGATDGGHEGGAGTFALDATGRLNWEGIRNFAHVGIHEMTVTGKALTQAMYGVAPKYSYFNGCSTGGRQGMMEAQRYPQDYNGIMSAAPAINWNRFHLQHLWGPVVMNASGTPVAACKLTAATAAAIAACDGIDGVKDGVIEDPTQCKFDPKVLACSEASDGPTCLTAPQVESARQVYASATNRSSKRQVTGLYPGSEPGWSTWGGNQGFGTSVDHFKYVVFKDPSWDFKSFDFEKDFAAADKVDNGLINALNPNLKAFFDRGGKLIQYHGWADPQISPGASVNYYKSVVDTMGGAAKVQGAYRLFMVPGMRHCRGGDVPDTFDTVTALEQWVEGGKAPEQLIASRVTKDGKVDRTRPLCPYPQTAQYKGTGSTDEAANFVCKAR